MSWFSGRVSLGNLDLAGAVNKLQESVKNIEKNFDTALGFEDKPESSNEGPRPSIIDRNLFDPVMALMGNKNEDSSDSKALEDSKSPSGTEESSEKHEPLQHFNELKEGLENQRSINSVSEETADEEDKVSKTEKDLEPSETSEETTVLLDHGNTKSESTSEQAETPVSNLLSVETSDSINHLKENNISPKETIQGAELPEDESGTIEAGSIQDSPALTGGSLQTSVEARGTTDDEKLHGESNEQVQVETKELTHVESVDEKKTEAEEDLQKRSLAEADLSGSVHGQGGSEASPSSYDNSEENESAFGISLSHLQNMPPSAGAEAVSTSDSREDGNTKIKSVEFDQQVSDSRTDFEERHLNSGMIVQDSSDSLVELEKVKKEMKMMEAALQSAARQAQAKADEMERLMNENEHLKAVIEDLKRKSNDAEIESLREEYHQRLATLEKKVYAVTRERDTLKREQNKRSDAAALLKEKDEIITQVMAEGEELSKKQAVQESLIRKLRAQVRELEEDKKGLMTKLQVEENKVETIKKDKTATEQLLQETIEKHQAELAFQKEYYTNALNAAKEAEAVAEARANSEARTELESRLREAEEREAMLVQTLEELRQTLSRKEQQAAFREDMLRRDIEDLQKRYQASERRCEELITQVPESTRPLLRQIEAMQETTARRAEAWAAVERSLNTRLQEAEGKAAAAEEREHAANERLSQTLSRINVLEAQISCLRAEQTQLSRSLEKERQRAAEIRQEYLAAKEEADTQEGRANQLDEEIRELRRKHKQELQEAVSHRELLQQEIEREKTARLDLERTARLNSTAVIDQAPETRRNINFENGNVTRKLSSASSLGSIEESYFLQASLDSSDSFSDRRSAGEAAVSPYYVKSMTPSTFEAALRQKEGELASYMSRLKSMESIRDSLAEELVKMTAQCEKLRTEASTLPGIRAELDALRRRHSAALELMGERDEELEELRADIVDLKEMYREQVNLLVNKIQMLGNAA